MPIGPATLSGFSAAAWFVRFLRDPIQTIIQTRSKFGAFVQLPHPRLFSTPPRSFFVAIGADFNREVLRDPTVWRPVHVVPAGPRNSALRRIGEGLIYMKGRQHEHYRRLIVQPLLPKSVTAMGADFLRMAEANIDSWKMGTVIDLSAHIQKLLQKMAIGLLFGDDRVHGLPIADMIHTGVGWSIMAAFCPVNVPGTPFARSMREAEVLESRIIEWANCKRGNLNEHDMLSLLANSSDENGHLTSDKIIVGHVPTLFGAAYETCQQALIWTLILLDQHPQIARDLYDELQDRSASVAMTFEQLIQLPLLTAVVNESMRILPPVPQQFRVALRATSLGNYPVPKESRVVLSSLLTNRDPDLYPEANHFKPERWATINPSSYEYSVFSAGPRGCPGYSFGTSVIKVVVATILKRYRVALVPNTRIDYKVRVTMAPRESVPAILNRQDAAFEANTISGTIRKLVQFPN